MSEPALRQVIEELTHSKRYRAIDLAAIERIARAALHAGCGNASDAVKRAKRDLHQMYGAFVGPMPRYEHWIERLRGVPRDSDLRNELLRECMSHHASTRERLPVLDRFYADIFACAGVPSSIVDVGCGLNPLAHPWMGLRPDCTYRAVDVDHRLMRLVAEGLSLLAVHATCEVRDAVQSPPASAVDLAFLLKTLPCFDQQQRGAGLRLLDATAARVAVVSFPTRSLGGRAKGMPAHYSRQYERDLRMRASRLERIDFGCELVYLVWR